MKINTKKITSLALATIIAVGSTSAYAASFKDIDKGHWAASYIKKGNDLELLQGYEDGTFKPEKSIARIEAISLAGRAMNISKAEKDEAIKQYEKTILDKKFEAWAVPDLSVALSQGIIKVSNLDQIYHSNGSFILSSREEAAIYMAKAMGLQKEAEELGTSIKLPFKDSKKITEGARPYVFLLHKHKIVRGDEHERFNPTDPIDRASMSVILSSAYDYIEQKKTDNQPVKPEKPEDGKEYVQGKISRVFSALGDDHVVIVNSKGESINYKLDEKSELKLEDKAISHSDLIEGLEVKITITEDKDIRNLTIKTLEAKNKVEKLEGIMNGFEDSDNKTLTIEYKENEESKERTISLNKDTKISLDGKEAKLTDLKRQDRIKIRVTNNVIDIIEAEAYSRDKEGILKNIDTNSKYVDIKTEDGTEIRYDLSADADIIRSGKSVKLNQLRKGDKVVLTVADDLVIKVKAEIVKNYVEGVIKSKKISYNSGEITILNEKTRREETYVVPNNIVIELDDQRVVLDKLELGYYVGIDLEGEEVIGVTGTSEKLEGKFLGRITETNAGNTRLDVTLNTGEHVNVDIRSADVSNLSGGSYIDKSSLKKGNNIIIIGDIYGDEIIASKVMRFSN